jgi:hypothetical protein
LVSPVGLGARAAAVTARSDKNGGGISRNGGGGGGVTARARGVLCAGDVVVSAGADSFMPSLALPADRALVGGDDGGGEGGSAALEVPGLPCCSCVGVIGRSPVSSALRRPLMVSAAAEGRGRGVPCEMRFGTFADRTSLLGLPNTLCALAAPTGVPGATLPPSPRRKRTASGSATAPAGTENAEMRASLLVPGVEATLESIAAARSASALNFSLGIKRPPVEPLLPRDG